MLIDDTYKTIIEPAEGLFRDKGSKFLATAVPIKKADDIKPILEELRNAHPKANHHCWALRIGSDRGNFKLSDDGEPSGTAGRPILNTLLSQDVTDIAIIVTRYFGGTLLGVTGLINAYKASAQEVLANAKIITKTYNDIYRFSFDHLGMNDIMRIVKDKHLKIKSQNYTTQNELDVEIRKSEVSRVIDQIEKLRNIEIKFLYSE